MTASTKAGTSIDLTPATLAEVRLVEPGPVPIYDLVEPGKVNGARLLKATRYNFELAGALIATRTNWKDILESIVSPELIANTRAVVIQIREALGLPVD